MSYLRQGTQRAIANQKAAKFSEERFREKDLIRLFQVESNQQIRVVHIELLQFIIGHRGASKRQMASATRALTWLNEHPSRCLHHSFVREFEKMETTLRKVDAGLLPTDPAERHKSAIEKGLPDHSRAYGWPRKQVPAWLNGSPLPLKPPTKKREDEDDA